MSGKPPPYQPIQGYYEGQGVSAPAQPTYNQPPHPGYNPNYQGNPKQPINHHPHHHHPPNYGSGYQQTTIIQSVPVVVVGGCPACRVGVLEDDFTCLGVCCAIAFFPLGLLCCLAMKQRRCPNCGAIFG